MTATVGRKFISSSSLARWLLLLRVALNNRQAGRLEAVNTLWIPEYGRLSVKTARKVTCFANSNLHLVLLCDLIVAWRIDTNRQMRCCTKANSHWILNTQIDRQLLEASKTSSVVLAHSMPPKASETWGLRPRPTGSESLKNQKFKIESNIFSQVHLAHFPSSFKMHRFEFVLYASCSMKLF